MVPPTGEIQWDFSNLLCMSGFPFSCPFSHFCPNFSLTHIVLSGIQGHSQEIHYIVINTENIILQNKRGSHRSRIESSSPVLLSLKAYLLQIMFLAKNKIFETT